MGSVLAFFRRRQREGEEIRKKYEEALSPSSLAPNGGNYVILNSSSEKSDLLAVTTHKDGKSSACLSKWKSGHDHGQIFKVEPCIDFRNDCVVSCHGNKEPKLQWIVEDESGLEMEAYPVAGEERLRPPSKKWRFRFEETSPPGSQLYRIVSMDDDLDGNDCLALIEGTKKGSQMPKLGFKRRRDDDQTQLWYLTSA